MSGTELRLSCFASCIRIYRFLVSASFILLSDFDLHQAKKCNKIMSLANFNSGETGSEMRFDIFIQILYFRLFVSLIQYARNEQNMLYFSFILFRMSTFK